MNLKSPVSQAHLHIVTYRGRSDLGFVDHFYNVAFQMLMISDILSESKSKYIYLFRQMDYRSGGNLQGLIH